MNDNETAHTPPPPSPTLETKPLPLQIVFLGLCEHIRQLRESNFNIFKFNILGLKSVVLLPFLPLPLPPSWYFVFAMRGLQSVSSGLTIRLRILSEDQIELGYVTIGMAAGEDAGEGSAAPAEANHVAYNGSIDGWGIVSLQVNAPIVFARPGRYSIVRRTADDAEEHIGEFYLAVVNAAPFTSEAIAAIRTDPLAVKSARMTLGCNECQAELIIFTSLDGRSKPLPQGFTWYEDLPDTFTCDCGKNVIDLRSIRRNFFVALGRSANISPTTGSGKSTVVFDPMYRASNLDGLYTEFTRLLDLNPPEERIQKFIEQNTILLRQFPAIQVLFKPPVSTFYKADFAIVSPQRELTLIEIETTRTRLLKKDGDQASGLTHAVDQVQNRLHTFREHRLSCLASLQIEPALIGPIRGVVIAGRDKGYNPDHLRRLKTNLSGQVTLLTYDDLATSLVTLAHEMQRV